MNFLRSYVLSGVLALLFLISTVFVLKEYQGYALQKQKADTFEVKLKLSKQEHSETERKYRILSRVNAFVDNAERLSLTREKWSVYDVNLSEPVSFSEIEQILNTCSHSQGYVFKPILLHLKSAEAETSETKKKKQPTPSADSSGVTDGDYFMSLTGAFVVKSR